MNENQITAEDKTGSFPKGKITALNLAKKGIKSPEIKRSVRIKTGLYMNLPEGKTEDQFRAEKLLELSIKRF